MEFRRVYTQLYSLQRLRGRIPVCVLMFDSNYLGFVLLVVCMIDDVRIIFHGNFYKFKINSKVERNRWPHLKFWLAQNILPFSLLLILNRWICCISLVSTLIQQKPLQDWISSKLTSYILYFHLQLAIESYKYRRNTFAIEIRIWWRKNDQNHEKVILQYFLLLTK